MTQHADDSPGLPDAEAPPEAREPVATRRTLIGPFTARQIALINAVVVGAALLLFVVTRPIGSAAPSPTFVPGAGFYRIGAQTQGLEIGQRAPELTGESEGKAITLASLEGKPLSLASLKGRPVWINFWATWCPPCQEETPTLRDAYEAHKSEGLVLVAIDVQEDAGTVREYATSYGLTYEIGLDTTGAIFRAYRVFGLPTHYFIDRDGVVRGRYYGPLNRELVEQQLKPILEP